MFLFCKMRSGRLCPKTQFYSDSISVSELVSEPVSSPCAFTGTIHRSPPQYHKPLSSSAAHSTHRLKYFSQTQLPMISLVSFRSPHLQHPRIPQYPVSSESRSAKHSGQQNVKQPFDSFSTHLFVRFRLSQIRHRRSASMVRHSSAVY